MQRVRCENPHIEIRECWEAPNAKVSDGCQPPLTFDLCLSESAGSRSLHRLVWSFEFLVGLDQEQDIRRS
jgi:hypothetical protein